MHSQRSRNGEVDDDTGDVDERRHQGRRRSRGISPIARRPNGSIAPLGAPQTTTPLRLRGASAAWRRRRIEDET
jgi:hypothetical protein